MREFSSPRYNIIKVTPEQFGYKDRGILKWQGLILSDHTDALKKELNQVTDIEAKEEMSEVEISKVLMNAYKTDHSILVQANVINNGNYYNDLECKVLGYEDSQIFFLLKDGRTVNCTLGQIRNVEFMSTLDWFDKI